jgi:hypothetical protein
METAPSTFKVQLASVRRVGEDSDWNEYACRVSRLDVQAYETSRYRRRDT